MGSADHRWRRGGVAERDLDSALNVESSEQAGEFGDLRNVGEFGYGFTGSWAEGGEHDILGPASLRRPGRRFFGVGPRGFRRSDDRIREEVCDLLTDNPDIDPREIEVSVEQGEVRLDGAVATRTMKRIVDELVNEDTIAGVAAVFNRLRVRENERLRPPGPPPQPAGEASRADVSH